MVLWVIFDSFHSICLILPQDATKVNCLCWLRVSFPQFLLRSQLIDIIQYSTTFTPDEDGDWEFGMNVAGCGNLFVDGKVVVDLTTPPPAGSDAFFGQAADNRTTVKGLKAGHKYSLEMRANNRSLIEHGTLFDCWGIIRAGANRLVDGEAAIRDAAALAKDSDGMHSQNRRCLQS